MKVIIRFLVINILLIGMLGCGVPKILKPEPKPTLINISLSASADVNQDSGGRASPIVFRLYGLKSADVFNTADFFALFENDNATLAADFVERQEIILVPGQQQQLERVLDSQTRYLGFVAAYRDLDQAVWRQILSVVPNKKTDIDIALGALKMVVKSSR